MSKRLSLILTILCCTAMAQVRIVPHLTASGGAFTSEIILANTGDEAAGYRLVPYLIDGTLLDSVSGELQAGETLTMSPTELFNNTDVSHFTIGEDDAIEVTVAYQDKDGNNSEAHVRDTRETAYRWRIYPGSLSDVADGLAAVNPTDEAILVQVRQVDAAGTEYGETLDLFELAGNAKGIHVFASESQVEDAFYEVFSDTEFALTALRFATGNDRYFWQTAAVPMSQLITVDPRVGMVANLTTAAHDVAGQVVIADERTLRIDNFTYDGSGLDVRLYLAVDSDYRNGISVGSDLRRGTPYMGETLTFDLPGSVTLDSFNSVSIWCVPAAASFGHGVFEAP